MPAMSLFFGEKAGTVGDDEAQVAGTRLVYPGKIDFIQDAMAQREPYPAVLIERRASSGFGAGGPARRNSRPAGCKPFDLVITH